MQAEIPGLPAIKQRPEASVKLDKHLVNLLENRRIHRPTPNCACVPEPLGHIITTTVVVILARWP